ncbi:MAG: hypothetical protein WD623_08920 [Marinobacter sp.]|uniref:hypothetical protein n=1 Tax=Marinobacter sp. TaxID=50741 RepID=UPI0034A00E49
MSDTDKHHPDKTPVFGLDDLDRPATPSDEAGGDAVARTTKPKPAEGAGPAIVLYDKLSGVHVVTDKFPVEIGNGRRFDMALRGPGPDGLYARIEQDAGGLAIECCHQRVFMAVDMVEAPRHRLIEPASIQLGDHLISFNFSEETPAKPRRKRPKWTVLAAAALLVLGLFLLRLLLVADEAESRVTVVVPAKEQRPVDALEAQPGPDGEVGALVPIVNPPVNVEAKIPEPDAQQMAGASQAEDEPETFQPAPLAIFFMTTRALPVAVAPESVVGSTEPASQAKSESTTPGAQPRLSGARNVAPTLVERYQRGEPIMTADAPPALRQALTAIREFYDSEILNTQVDAWETLVAAEKQLGLDQPSARREQIRASLGSALSKAAAEQAVLDNARLAYGYYYLAAELGHGNAQGSDLMTALDDKAARLYRFGYRLKYADPSTAGAYWTRVMDEVPSQSAWHRKAKLALNQTKGVRG